MRIEVNRSVAELVEGDIADVDADAVVKCG